MYSNQKKGKHSNQKKENIPLRKGKNIIRKIEEWQKNNKKTKANVQDRDRELTVKNENAKY